MVADRPPSPTQIITFNPLKVVGLVGGSSLFCLFCSKPNRTRALFGLFEAIPFLIGNTLKGVNELRETQGMLEICP
jgi:hypothetical protein